MRRGLERRPPAEHGDRLVGTTVGDEHDILHGVITVRSVGEPGRRTRLGTVTRCVASASSLPRSSITALVATACSSDGSPRDEAVVAVVEHHHDHRGATSTTAAPDPHQARFTLTKVAAVAGADRDGGPRTATTRST